MKSTGFCRRSTLLLALAWIAPSVTKAQSQHVARGTVVDTNGKPIAGADDSIGI